MSSNPDSPELPLPRVRESRHLDKLSRTGSHASFEVPAVLSMMRSHPKLYQQMVESENKIEQAFEDHLFKNWPVCKFFRRRDEKMKKAIGKLEECLIKLAQQMITRAQDLIDENEVSALLAIATILTLQRRPRHTEWGAITRWYKQCREFRPNPCRHS